MTRSQFEKFQDLCKTSFLLSKLTKLITYHPPSAFMNPLHPPPKAMQFDPRTRSPTLQKLLKTRLAPIREKELLSKARNPEKPTRPSPGDCCGSSCKPCVMDLYREELLVWKECWVVNEMEEENIANILEGKGNEVAIHGGLDVCLIEEAKK